MKKFIPLILTLACASAFAGISATKHNLSTGGTGSNHLTTGTDQICVFCHTPHGSDTSAPAPLWNRVLPAGNTFTTYAAMNSSTIQGEILNVGSVSLACLSCHDGTQGMDVMINRPGSGGYNSAGAAEATNVWAGNATMSGVANLGKNLQNDHPIGIEYCGGGLTQNGSGVVSGTCNDEDFVGVAANGVVGSQVNGLNTMYVNRNGTAGRQKDDLPLFTRTFTAGTTGSVECATCHDPHVASKGSDNIHFMRVTTAGSAICLACHVK